MPTQNNKVKVAMYVNHRLAQRLSDIADRYEGPKGDLIEAALDVFLAEPEERQQAALLEVLRRKTAGVFADPKGKRGG